jgi:MFS superfamily sulfate permease-like transporter
LVVGLLCLASRMARLGFVADLLSRPILVGYIAGVALIMMVGQLAKLTGVPVTGESFFGQLASFATRLSTVHLVTTVLGAAVLAFLFVAQRWLPAAPGPLLAVLLATAAVALFGLERHGVPVIGAIPSGPPVPALPPVRDLPELVLPALGVLLVGYTDNILTARAFAGRRGPEREAGRDVDANQELVALGVANAGAACCTAFRSAAAAAAPRSPTPPQPDGAGAPTTRRSAAAAASSRSAAGRIGST